MKRSAFCLPLIALLCLVPCTAVFAAQSIASGPAARVATTQAEVARRADALLQENYHDHGPGAAVLIARGDDVLYRAARGLADVERHVPLQPDSMFRIASVTKQFTAAGLLKLVEAGKVRLDDPLSKYVADYPGGDRITVLQLLNHTSGVKDYTSLAGFEGGSNRKDLTTSQLVDTFRHESPDFAPGTRWAYSNSNYVLLGAVIESASGMSWYAWLQHSLFEPLGMDHTGYGQDPNVVARQVHGYSIVDGKAVAMQPMSMTQPHAAGALVSNVDDLLKWNRALHEGHVLKDPTYKRMVTPLGAAAAAGADYGFGIVRDTLWGRERLGHGGAIDGFMSYLMYLPGPGITVAVLENDDAKDGVESASSLAGRLAAIALGEPEQGPEAAAAVDTPAVELPRAALERLTGTYVSARLTMQVFLDGKTLKAQLPGQPPVTLKPSTSTQFQVVEAPALLEFAAGGEPAATVTMRQGGRALELTRRP